MPLGTLTPGKKDVMDIYRRLKSMVFGRGENGMQFNHESVRASAIIQKNAPESRALLLCGAGGSRTRVQTNPPIAFYMFIATLFVGVRQG